MIPDAPDPERATPTYTLRELESEWLSLRDMYAGNPQLGNLRQVIEAGEAYVQALHRAGQAVPAKVSDSLALFEDLVC